MYQDRSPLSRSSSPTLFNNIRVEMTNPTTLSYNEIQTRFNFAKCMVPEYYGGSKELCYF